MTWTFHLRKGAAFSDGHPITAEDVLFSFEVVVRRELCIPPMQDMLQSEGKNFKVTAPDPHTVVINTGKPHAALLDALCPGSLPHHAEACPAGRHTRTARSRRRTTSARRPTSMVTSGAWRARRSTCTNEKTVLVRNPYYYGFDQNNQRLPYLDELVILVVPDQDAADLKFRAGELDAVDDVKPENYQWYEENQQKGNFTLHDLGRVAGHALHVVQPEQGAAARARREAGRTANGWASRSSIR